MHNVKIFVSVTVLSFALGCSTESGKDTAQLEGSIRESLELDNRMANDKLTSSEITAAEEFMGHVEAAFENKDANLLERLSHAGGDPRGIKNTIEYNQNLMNGGDRVKSWTAKRYERPDWDYLKTNDFYPEPTVWVDVVLNNGSGDYFIFFALAPNAEGDLRSCYYIDKK